MTPRLRALAKEEADPSVRPDLEALEKSRGRVPNLFATLARRPGTTRAAAALLREAFAPGEVSARLKEMVAIRVSRFNACEYCIDSHTKLARAAGATEDDLMAVHDAGCGELAPPEAAALRLADAVAAPGGKVADDLWTEVRAHWSETAALEITTVAAAFSFFNRVANSLQIEPTR